MRLATSVQMVLTENLKIAEEVQNTLKGKLGRIRQKSEAESGQKDDSKYSDCRST